MRTFDYTVDVLIEVIAVSVLSTVAEIKLAALSFSRLPEAQSSLGIHGQANGFGGERFNDKGVFSVLQMTS